MSRAISSFSVIAVIALVTTGRLGSQQRPPTRSKISIYSLKSGNVEVVYTADTIWEAPNWSRDGKYLVVNSGGNLYRLPVDTKGAQPQKIDLGSITGCNNDHGISPDG